MPELPEVETVRRQLAQRIIGRQFTSFHLKEGGERCLRGADPNALHAQLQGATVTAVGRRGKYLLLHLDSAQTLVIHLRMTGALHVVDSAADEEKFTRAVFDFTDRSQLRFLDLRKFGTIDLADDPAAVLPELGPEPLSSDFTPAALWHALRGRQTPLKAALLDQRTVAGVGNIYADEALHQARLHPECPAGSLRPPERRNLHAAIQTVLEEGVKHGGASFRDYTDVGGHEGTQQFHVQVFRRTNQPCDHCQTTIRKITVGGRATHFCPKCQSPRQRTRQVTSTRPKQ